MTSLSKAPRASISPFIFAGAAYLTQAALKASFLKPHLQMDSSFQPNSLLYSLFHSKGSFNRPTETSDPASHEIFGDYLTFMLLSIIFNLLMILFAKGKGCISRSNPKHCQLPKEIRSAAASHSSSPSFDAPNEHHQPHHLINLIRPLIKGALCYTLAFCFFEITLFLCAFAFSSSKEISLQSSIPRILEEEEDPDTPPLPETKKIPEKISLAMGRELASFDVEATIIAMSKDEKWAYVSTDSPQMIRVYDISDSKAVVQIAAVELGRTQRNRMFLELSADGTILVASNYLDVKIINVSNPSSPKLVGSFFSPMYESSEGMIFTSMAISPDNQYLFMAEVGFAVLNISNPSNITMLYSSVERTYQGVGTLISLSASSDRKLLYLANAKGGLETYNVTNPSQPLLINKFTLTGSTATSVFLSKYDNLAYVIGLTASRKMAVNVIDVSNPLNQKEISKFAVATTYTSTPIIQSLSPRETKLYIIQRKLMTIDLVSKTIESNSQDLVKNNLLSICFSSSGKNTGVVYFDQIVFLELFTEYPNTKIFTPSNTSIASFTLDRRFDSWAVDNHGNTLYVSFNDYERLNASFEIWDIRNKEVPKLIISLNATELEVNLTEPFLSFKMSPDNKRAYLKWWTYESSELVILDVSSSPIQKLKTFFVPLSLNFDDFAFSNNEKILCIAPDSSAIILYDLHGPVQNFIELHVKSDLASDNFRLHFIKNDTILLIVTSRISIYNVSDLSGPVFLGSIAMTEGGSPRILSTIVLDKEGDYLIVEWFQYSRKLRVYDLSNILKPKLISELPLPKRNLPETQDILLEFYGPFVYSSEQKMGYASTNGKLLRIDLSDLKNPMVSGIVPVTPCVRCENSRFIISPDGNTAFATNRTGMLRSLNLHRRYPEMEYADYSTSLIFAVDLQIRSTLYIPQEKFFLGERFSDNVFIFKNLGKDKYQMVSNTNSKILKLNAYEVKVLPSEINPHVIPSSLPAWMRINYDTLLLTVEPKSKKDLGVYTICARISNEVNRFALDNIGPVNNTFDDDEIFSNLIALGYMDRQFYLTTDFGTRDGFFLPKKYVDYKGQIYDILSRYYVEDCTKIEIVKSLKVDVVKNRIQIDTPSTEAMKIDITLVAENQDAQFLNKVCGPLIPEIRDQKYRIILEGSLNDIYTALQHVVINTKNNGTVYDGLVTVSDGMNYPIVNQRVSKISDCFLKNTPPSVNPNSTKTFQEQLERVSVATGQYFTIMWEADTFTDNYSETLHYDVVIDNDARAENPKAFPDWLTFSGLALRGTPPEKLSDREIPLKFIVKNEFQNITIPFKLKIGISPTFALSLLIKYSPMLLTALGFYIKANRIYNIVAKKRYKHAKEHEVTVGEEISSKTLLPILLIEKELKESQLIMRYLIKHVKKGSVSELVSHFVTRTLEKNRIIESINQALFILSPDQKKKLSIYLEGSDFNKKKILQIIINQIVMFQLESSQEKSTKRIFNQIKEQWADLVEWDPELLFVVNKQKLSELLNNNSLNTEEESPSLLQESRREINEDLLQDALISYTFSHQSVDARSTMVLVEFYERVADSGWLKSFLKRDLEGSHLNSKASVDYGVDCHFEEGVMYFSGTPKQHFKGRTLAIQIQTIQFRILKEIWIREKSAESGNAAIGVSSRTESSLRGNAYEVY